MACSRKRSARRCQKTLGTFLLQEYLRRIERADQVSLDLQIWILREKSEEEEIEKNC
jgi:hypothetical protein